MGPPRGTPVGNHVVFTLQQGGGESQTKGKGRGKGEGLNEDYVQPTFGRENLRRRSNFGYPAGKPEEEEGISPGPVDGEELDEEDVHGVFSEAQRRNLELLAEQDEEISHLLGPKQSQNLAWTEREPEHPCHAPKLLYHESLSQETQQLNACIECGQHSDIQPLSRCLQCISLHP